jgi:hypothetical protein
MVLMMVSDEEMDGWIVVMEENVDRVTDGMVVGGSGWWVALVGVW